MFLASGALAAPREIIGPCDRCVVPTLMTSIFAPDPACGAVSSTVGTWNPTSPALWLVGRWMSTLGNLVWTKRSAPSVGNIHDSGSRSKTSSWGTSSLAARGKSHWPEAPMRDAA